MLSNEIALASALAALALAFFFHSTLRAEAGERQEAVAALEAKVAEAHEQVKAVERANAVLARRLKALRRTVKKAAVRPQRARARRLAVAVSRRAETSGSERLVWPLAGTLTSPFGDGRNHPGIDIGAPEGTPVRAAAAGRVVEAGWEEGYGNYVAIDHGQGRRTAYGHLAEVWVGTGSAVSRGDAIGSVGCTGRCTGPHLHFEVLVGGDARDPLGFLPG